MGAAFAQPRCLAARALFARHLDRRLPGAACRNLGAERAEPIARCDLAPASLPNNGILELDNNAAKRGMRALALGRKNCLFVGSEAGGKTAAIAYTLIETAKLNTVDPDAWLAETLARNPGY